MTEVNDTLQGMERHHGVHICTTHWLDSLGAATLRCFSFKIEFFRLIAPQRGRMFCVEALGGNSSLLDGAMAHRLDQLTQPWLCRHKKSPLAADLSEAEAATLRP